MLWAVLVSPGPKSAAARVRQCSNECTYLQPQRPSGQLERGPVSGRGESADTVNYIIIAIRAQDMFVHGCRSN